MTHIGAIKAAAELAATQSLTEGTLRDIIVESAIGSEGQEILRITLVIDDAAFGEIRDDDFLTTSLSVKHGVREAGDGRQAIIGYATQSELDDHGDPES